jgi:hypothetical protein
MAETARVLNTGQALIKIADRFDALADQREQEQLRHKFRGGGASRSDWLLGEPAVLGSRCR